MRAIRIVAFLAAITGSVDLFMAIVRIRFHTPLFVVTLMLLASAIICGAWLIHHERRTVGGLIVIAFSLGYYFIATEVWKHGLHIDAGTVFHGIPLAVGLFSGALSSLFRLFEHIEKRNSHECV